MSIDAVTGTGKGEARGDTAPGCAVMASRGLRRSEVAAESLLSAVLDALPRHLQTRMQEGDIVICAPVALLHSGQGADAAEAMKGPYLAVIEGSADLAPALPRRIAPSAEAVVVIAARSAIATEAVPAIIGDTFVLSAHADVADAGRVVLVYEPLLEGAGREAARSAFAREAGRMRAALVSRHAGGLAPLELEHERDLWRERSVQLQRLLTEVLTSRTWRSMDRARAALAKFRGVPYQAPRIPPMPDLPPPAAPIERTPTTALPPVVPATDRRPIVMLLESFDFGGVERVVLDLSERLTRRGRAIVILVVGQEGRLAAEARKAGMTVIAMSGDLARLDAEIRRIEPALAFAHHSYAGWEAFAACGAPIVEVIQNIYHWQRGNGHIAGIRRHLTKAITCSRAVRAYSIEHLGLDPGRLELIPNGIDPRGLVRPPVEELRRMRRSSRETVFVQTSHIWANKCHHTTLSAFEAVLARHPEARLVFDGTVGHADVGEAIRSRIARAGLGDVVAMINSKSRAEISQVYASAHAFLLPSIVEGLSIATLEAAYFGVPQILTDTGGARDLLETDNGTTPFGIIVKPPIEAGSVTPDEVDRIGRLELPSHVDAVVAAMLDIAADRDRWIERGLAGIARAEEFHIDRIVDRYEALIDATVAGGR